MHKTKQIIKPMLLHESGLPAWQSGVKSGALSSYKEYSETLISEGRGSTFIINVEGILTYNDIWFGTTYTAIATTVGSAETDDAIDTMFRYPPAEVCSIIKLYFN